MPCQTNSALQKAKEKERNCNGSRGPLTSYYMAAEASGLLIFSPANAVIGGDRGVSLLCGGGDGRMLFSLVGDKKISVHKLVRQESIFQAGKDLIPSYHKRMAARLAQGNTERLFSIFN